MRTRRNGNWRRLGASLFLCEQAPAPRSPPGFVGYGEGWTQRLNAPPAEGATGPPASKAGKVLRWLGIAIVGIVVLAVIVAFFLPRHAIVTRSVEIAAPPSAIYPIVGPTFAASTNGRPGPTSIPPPSTPSPARSTASGRRSTGRARTKRSVRDRWRSRPSSRTNAWTCRSTSAARGRRSPRLSSNLRRGHQGHLGLRQRPRAQPDRPLFRDDDGRHDRPRLREGPRASQGRRRDTAPGAGRGRVASSGFSRGLAAERPRRGRRNIP